MGKESGTKPPEKIFASYAFQTVGKRRKDLLSIYAFFILALEGRQIVVRRCATLLYCQRYANTLKKSTSQEICRGRYAETWGIFSVRQCIFLAHAGHIRAYLHGIQPFIHFHSFHSLCTVTPSAKAGFQGAVKNFTI